MNGWWWNSFGNDGFTAWDMISLITYYEASNFTEYADLFAEASVRWFYGAEVQTNKKKDDIYSLYNWYSHYSQSAGDYVKTNSKLTLREDKNPNDMQVVGNSFKNPP